MSDDAAVLAVSPAPQANAAAASGSGAPRPALDAPASILALIGIALAGGFILNLMPCVFPVLSLKLLSFVHGGAGDRGQVRKGFAASAAGIVVSFLLLAGVLAGMKWAGASVGWGIQFQQPLFLGGMAVVLSLFAASQFGLFHLAVSSGLLTRVTGVARRHIERRRTSRAASWRRCSQRPARRRWSGPPWVSRCRRGPPRYSPYLLLSASAWRRLTWSSRLFLR